MYYLTNLFNLKNSFIKRTKSSKGDLTFMYNITTIPDVIFCLMKYFVMPLRFKSHMHNEHKLCVKLSEYKISQSANIIW